MATEEPQTNLAQTIASNLEAVIEPAAVLAVAVAPGEPVVRAELAELAAQGAREALEELAVQVVQEALAEPAAQVVREALEELAAQVAVAQVLVQAVEVPELVPVGAVRVLVRAAAELERGQVPGVAVRLRTRSVIAARRPGQVPLLAGAEDLAVVVVATMHAPAATEAATAWEAAE